MKRRETHDNWRADALALGVNPDDPDDFEYWSRLDRARAIVESFRYHMPTPAQIERIAEVRRAHIVCALSILCNSPQGADQTAALRKLHESMMTTNKAIVCEPRG